MKIQKMPDAVNVRLQDIAMGECFMTIEDEIEDRASPYDYEWDEGELFMRGETAGSNMIYVFHLESGSHDQFSGRIWVRKVKAHIVCE